MLRGLRVLQKVCLLWNLTIYICLLPPFQLKTSRGLIGLVSGILCPLGKKGGREWVCRGKPTPQPLEKAPTQYIRKGCPKPWLKISLFSLQHRNFWELSQVELWNGLLGGDLEVI